MRLYRNSSINWKPSPIVALATSADDSQVAAAREDGSLEIWLVSPGSAGWHCQLTVHGDPKSRVTSLVWCLADKKGLPDGRLFSSSIDGSVSEWDLSDLKQKIVLQSIGFTIWQMAVAPSNNSLIHAVFKSQHVGNGYLNYKSNDSDDHETSESENDSDSDEQSVVEDRYAALACDDGCVRIYRMTDSNELLYYRSLPRVSGRVLSVTWSDGGDIVYSGSSDGFIRSWDAKLGYEVYRITVGLGGLGSGPELCIWSLLFLRCGTLVSADSSGSVQFWNSQHGTLLQAHSLHKGDVNALAAAPSHNRVFSAGSDGQVILYKVSSERIGSSDDQSSSEVMKKWVYVGSVRAHTHDIRALTVAVPISCEDALPDEKVKRTRGNFSYRKWAHLGVPMLISAGDDTKLFAYSANEFTKFSPHDICPAPQRVPIHLVHYTVFSHMSLLLVQHSCRLDVLSVCVDRNVEARSSSGVHATTSLLVQVKSKASRKIICSTISNSGMFFAYSDHVTPNLFELKRGGVGKSEWTVNKRKFPRKLPFAHSMIFSCDSSQLIIAGYDRRIRVVDVFSSEVVHTFTPCHEEHDEELPPREPPITKMFCSPDGQWLAAVNCFGDVYIFNLEIQRQHWFISRLDGASVAAAGFHPQKTNVLIITTSSNQVYVFDVEAKQLGEWSKHHIVLPRRYQEFPGEVIGLSFSPSPSSPSVIIYSARAMCVIDFRDKTDVASGQGSALKKMDDNPINGSVKRKLPDCEAEADALTKIDSTPINGRLKRKLPDCKAEANGLQGSQNFDFFSFKDPVLFFGHLSKGSMLIIDKPWMEVVKTFNAPVHRHLYGT